MAKKPRPVRHFLEYAAARTIVGGLSVMPMALASWFGRRLAGVLRHVDKRHRERVKTQAAERLGLSGRELDAFVRENFRCYGRTLGEFAKLSRYSVDDIRKRIDLGDFPEALREAMAGGKGCIVVTAHYGNWEWFNTVSSVLGLPGGGAIARPLDNPKVNEYVRYIRERNGLRILDKQGAIRKALGELRAGNPVGILIDQDGGKHGMMSPFLGRAASTITIPVELAIRTGCPLLPAILRRNQTGKQFGMVWRPMRVPNPDADPKAETVRLLDLVNADLTEMILEEPVQWFWLHRRWKSVGDFDRSVGQAADPAPPEIEA